MAQHQLWRQHIVAGVANIMVLCCGYSMGWTAPVSVKLRSASSPLDIIPSRDDIAWMGSLLTIGGVAGPFVGSPIASKLGRKWGLMSASVPMMVGWVLVVVAHDMTFLLVARVLWGIAAGIIFTTTPMYCAEIATDDARGALGSYLQVYYTIGCLLVYAVGPYISYWAIGYVGIAGVAVFVILFIFMPDTPTYHLLKNNREATISSLCTLRGRSENEVVDELNKIEIDVKTSMEKSAAITDLFRGSNFKAFYISCALMVFQQFSGINAVLFYITDIFKDSGIELDPAIATIIIGSVQLVASTMTPLVVDRLGRRLLMLVSSCGAAIGLLLLGMFFLLVANGSEVVASIGFLPVLSLVLFIVTYSWGLGPLPWAIMSELFPIEVKNVASPIITSFCWLMAFLVTRYFESVAVALGRHAAFWLFAGCCVLSFCFCLLLLPETKGKSFQEIQDVLAGRESSKAEKPKSRNLLPVQKLES